jgi:hypothetical protein
MFQFRLERGCDRTNRCRKMKRCQRVHLHSVGRKRDIAWWRDDIGQKRGDTREGKGEDDTSWTYANFNGPKNAENLRC